MSVFTKEAFQMSAMPTPASSAPTSNAPSRRGSFAHSATPHIVEINVESVLFDMDGTLINSSPAVVKAWELMAESYPLDLEDILHSAHGMRTIDALRKWCNIPEDKLPAEVVRFETAILTNAEEIGARTGKSGIEVLPGVERLLNDLSAANDQRNGEEKWAICTSSTYFYAGKAIPIAGLTTPKVFVTADDVKRGKPFPDPYLLGAEGCNASPFESLVVEDAPTGIRAGKAAGCRVLATCTSHSAADLEKERPDFLVEDLSHVKASWDAASQTFKLVIEQPVGRQEPRATPDSTPLVTPAGSRAASFSGDRQHIAAGIKPTGELTGNDSVVGSPVPSRPGSPHPNDKERTASQGAAASVTLDAFKRALAGNALRNGELSAAE
ncbi:Hexitol phosphatase A [Vanrija pseudolonga]|uniref:Hexitol phosphatase A n=1 Tax=Vanrija pseudolonga TaxID=143232 RepID=A0AAF0YEJ2_9TREE|nr:Hexitol phosphatase A [Vanrija pseudolonga]